MVSTEIVRRKKSIIMTGVFGAANSSLSSKRKGMQMPAHSPVTLDKTR